MKQESRKKRFFTNAFSILILLAVVFLASRFYNPTENVSGSSNPTDLPVLKESKILPFGGLDMSPESGKIQVALLISPDSTGKGLAADILEVYRWGRNHYNPIKCGPEYNPNLCKVVGQVWILLVVEDTRTPILTTEGEASGYVVIAGFWLDQIQIDKLLDLDTLPGTAEDLVTYHEGVAKQTQNTGGAAAILDTPQPFNGFK